MSGNDGFYEPTEDELAGVTGQGNVPASALNRALYGEETEEQMARRICRQALPHAMMSIVDIAQNSTNDRTRLTAAQYIVDRNLGKVTDDPALASSDTLAGIVEEFTKSLRA